MIKIAKKLICYPFRQNNDGTETMLDYVGIELYDNKRELCYERGVFQTKAFNEEILWYPQQKRNLILTYRTYGRGRSSVTFYWIDQNGNKYPMFLKDMDYMLVNNKAGNRIIGDFEFVKRGANYGIKMCGE